MKMKEWTGKRVLILGAARQGLAAARWLTRHGAIVTLNDRRAPDQMIAARAELGGTRLRSLTRPIFFAFLAGSRSIIR
jgi:UDP-N-acetylmuramoylalanine-D-glutamate ligase